MKCPKCGFGIVSETLFTNATPQAPQAARPGAPKGERNAPLPGVATPAGVAPTYTGAVEGRSASDDKKHADLAAIVSALASEWQVGGMGPDSMYGEFAIEVAKRALAAVASLTRDEIEDRVRGYFARVRKLGGDTGECQVEGVADWLLWRGVVVPSAVAAMMVPPEQFDTAKARVLCDWPTGEFRLWDDPDPHKPCFLVCPDGAMVGFSHHNGEGVDKARVQFIADACNAALAPPSASAARTPLADELSNYVPNLNGTVRLPSELFERIKLALK